MDQVGTLTITGRWPLSIDGLSLGFSKRHSKRYRMTSDGFARGHRLYKTLDQIAFVEALGVAEPKYCISYAGTDIVIRG